MSTRAVIHEVVSDMEIIFDLLELLSGKDYHPFGGPQSYLDKVKEYYDSQDEAGREFIREALVWLRDDDPSPRFVAYYRHCVEERQEETRQWLNRLNVQVPSDIMVLLEQPPSEEKCREGLKEHAAYALRLIDENGS